MKRLLLVLVYVLFFTLGNLGQEAEWTTVYSDKRHFIASFPGEPEQSIRQTETSFGKGTEHRWVKEGDGIAYEISVTDLTDLTVKKGSNELRGFYEAACIEIGGSRRECYGSAGFDMFGDEGVSGGFRTGAVYVEFHMFLVGKRWYVVKVQVKRSFETATRAARKRFMDDFHFTYVDEKEKKLKLGLPKSKSQNREFTEPDPPGFQTSSETFHSLPQPAASALPWAKLRCRSAAKRIGHQSIDEE